MNAVRDEAHFDRDGYLIIPESFRIDPKTLWYLVTLNRLEFFLVPAISRLRRPEIINVEDFFDFYPEAELLRNGKIDQLGRLQMASTHIRMIHDRIPSNHLWMRCYSNGLIRFYDSSEHTFGHMVAVAHYPLVQ